MLIEKITQQRLSDTRKGTVMHTAGPHQQVEKLDGKDINGRFMITCRDCEATAHHWDEEQALQDLAKTACAPRCKNCEALRRSYDKNPAVPMGGSCNDLTHTCPNDGNRWWQSNCHFHLWQEVTSDQEWEAVTRMSEDPFW